MNSEQKMVREFHEALGIPVASGPTIISEARRRLRLDLIDEELDELEVATLGDNLVGIADALGDLLVVVYGAALEYGLDMEPISAEIHRTNMTKKGGPVREDGKRMKPEGWLPPMLAPIVLAQQLRAAGGADWDELHIHSNEELEALLALHVELVGPHYLSSSTADEPLDTPAPYLESRDG